MQHCGHTSIFALHFIFQFTHSYMVVFKFGGASINSTDRIKNVAGIVKQYFTGKSSLLLVISAIGKTTNTLENIAEHFYAGNKEEALSGFEAIKQDHLAIAKELLAHGYEECIEHLNDIFTEAEWMLHDRPVRTFDYYYDQVVCIGELLSTIIIYHFFKENNLPVEWLDVRDLLRTDDNFRDANVDWAFTAQAVAKRLGSLGTQQKSDYEPQTPGAENASFTTHHSSIYITQGFVGATADNESTTLGREGSDYTAAIFANLLNAESLTIWKDVASVMNADPKLFADAQPMHELNYNEVIEMAYYGAQVIHPKTIKPLYQKNIPLYVKCFLDTGLAGTHIHNQPVKNLPPIMVYKQNQALLQFSSKDFSFAGEAPLAKLYHLFEELSIRPTLTQNGSVSFWCCMDNREDKIEKLALAASDLFDVRVEKDLVLLTIRHYQTPLVQQLTDGKDVVLTQQTKDTVQMLMR